MSPCQSTSTQFKISHAPSLSHSIWKNRLIIVCCWPTYTRAITLRSASAVGPTRMLQLAPARQSRWPAAIAQQLLRSPPPLVLAKRYSVGVTSRHRRRPHLILHVLQVPPPLPLAHRHPRPCPLTVMFSDPRSACLRKSPIDPSPLEIIARRCNPP